MTVRAYYYGSLTFPILLPLCLLLVRWHGTVGETILFFAQWTINLGTIPYILLAISAGVWMQYQTERRIYKLSLISPLLMMIPFVLIYSMLTLLGIGNSFGSVLIVTLACTLLYGYTCVGIVNCTLCLLKRAKIIAPQI